MTYNKCILIGYLCRDPELKQSATGSNVCTFAIGVTRKYTKKGDGTRVCDFLDIVAWGTTAEFVCKYFKKGSPIIVTGAVQKRSWKAKDGTQRSAYEIVADECDFAGEKKTASSNVDGFDPFSAGQTISAQFEEIGADDDLPL